MTTTPKIKRAVILGASGYIGQHLLQALIQAQWEVVIICRPKSDFIATRWGAKIVRDASELDQHAITAVINLAYPTGAFQRCKKDNLTIAETVYSLGSRAERVVHLSSLAVFGFQLEHPISRNLIPQRRDNDYVRLKIAMELALAHKLEERRLDIVRLGNVWGPGSPNWTARFADRILQGKPVAYEGFSGYSNATDVANVVSYILFLLERECPCGLEIHHLAELGDHPWSEFAGYIAAQIGLPVLRTRYSSGSWCPSVIRPVLANFCNAMQKTVRQVASGPRGGSYVQDIASLLPDIVVAKTWALLRRSASQTIGDVQMQVADTFMQVISCDKLFESMYDKSWHPPVSFEHSLENVRQWLLRVGYKPRATEISHAISPGSGASMK